MTLIEEDLISALKELQEASLSLAMISGKLPSASDLVERAIEWSKQVITLTENDA
ncbi:MAG: hypothetical protein PHY09_08520 [Desulfuromonadaceae bacterium]|nr:hypothetical protein [Desulfuromonadaceae bacterium]MDD5106829.1 hypothetical protein [Desulfuromonadaceae bacterium]